MTFIEAMKHFRNYSEAKLVADYCKDLNDPTTDFYCENQPGATFADWVIARAELNQWRLEHKLF